MAAEVDYRLMPEARAHVGFAAFLAFAFPKLANAAAPLARPVCVVSVLTNRVRGSIHAQLTADPRPPQTAREIGELLDSMPPGTILAWLG